MKIYFFLFFPFFLLAQFKITTPDSFIVVVDDSIVEFNSTWYDSLFEEAKQGKIYYQIAGSHTSGSSSIVKLRMPQVLTLPQVIRQVIFYYSLIEDEEERQKDKLRIYPLFENIDDHAYIRCRYSESIFYFEIKRWYTMPLPAKPLPEEKFIYNMIMQSVMDNTLEFGEIPAKVFNDVSISENKSVEEVVSIYQKVTLWNACR